MLGRSRLDGRTVRESVSPEEWQTRVELAACYRLIEHYRMSDLVYTHITARVPHAPEKFLINAYGLLFGEVTASNLATVDPAGNVRIDETGFGINTAGYVIHSAVHAARPDIACVMHIHTAAGMGVSCNRHGLLPITQHALVFHGRVAYHDYEGISFNPDERARLIASLGSRNNVMILRNHGLISCGRSIPEAFLLMFILERACQAQVAALAGGVEPSYPSEEAMRVTAALNDPASLPPRRDEHAWQACLRLLERLDPSYRE
jgi:ribulose-5-phosphate 4-epimerase/fuculose-1-phosphate aldolase